MYSKNDLKNQIRITDDKVECPVKDCTETVDRKRRSNNEGKNFVCESHAITITPSTYIYNDIKNNLVNHDDIELLNSILVSKRESRLENENSEDAVSWNVFRYLEKEDLLSQWLSKTTNEIHKDIEIMYWSYSESLNTTYTLLLNARKEFGEDIIKGSEPDIIIKTDKALFIIEAKLFSSNKTSGYSKTLNKRLENKKEYITGGNNLFNTIFKTDYKTIVNDQKYELMRFWLLGYWMAKEKGLNFQLINLVLDRNEKDIENDFGKHINQNYNTKFSRHTWESIYLFIKENGVKNKYKDDIVNYFENKAAGYNSNGKLRNKAFDV